MGLELQCRMTQRVPWRIDPYQHIKWWVIFVPQCGPSYLSHAYVWPAIIPGTLYHVQLEVLRCYEIYSFWPCRWIEMTHHLMCWYGSMRHGTRWLILHCNSSPIAHIAMGMMYVADISCICNLCKFGGCVCSVVGARGGCVCEMLWWFCSRHEHIYRFLCTVGGLDSYYMTLWSGGATSKVTWSCVDTKN